MTGSVHAPRLLRGIQAGRALSLAEHHAAHGVLALRGSPSGGQLIDLVQAAGLLGRGGAGFPTAIKLRAVAAGRRPVVIANCSEGEPASGKDRMLTRNLPHLLLDGAAVAARAVGAREVIISLAGSDTTAGRAVAAAIAERSSLPDPTFRIVHVPDRYLAGQESALVNFINTGALQPTGPPSRPFEKGVGGRPSLVQNAETLAHLALIARYGADWFRAAGTADEPGTTLITLSGAVARPGVYEVPRGVRLASLIAGAGGTLEPTRAYMTGGYFGTWIHADLAHDVRLSTRDLRPHGAALGAGVVFVLGAGDCGVAETARVTRYLAGQSAGQCGPCVFGLPALAGALEAIAAGTSSRRTPGDLARWLDQLDGRGGCNLPTGAVGFVRSAVDTFGPELTRHHRGTGCADCARTGRLPLGVLHKVAA